MPSVFYCFLIVTLGYLLGSVKVKGMSLGTSGVLIVALVFGHFGVEVPAVLRNFGLAMFVGSVGLISGPVFFRNFRQKVYSYLILGLLIILSGALVTVVLSDLAKVPHALAIGMFTGALTSTPGLAAAIEATGDSMASIGYGIAYPFGVIGVVLFVQLIPRLFRADLDKEVRLLHERLHRASKTTAADGVFLSLEPTGLMNLCLTLTLGVLLGSLSIPLPGGVRFSFGVAGGPLFVGLALGHFGHFGKLSVSVPEPTLKITRELGLCLFLLGAGVEAGAGFVDILRQYGAVLFLIGVAITLLPMLLATALAVKLFRLDLLSTLGSVCGGMTSTPALGALISSCKSEDVAASYAATYPFALIAVVIGAQLLAMLW